MLVNQTTKKVKRDGKFVDITYGGVLAHMVHKTTKFLNHIHSVHKSDVISKRVELSFRHASTRGLHTYERRTKTM